MSELDAKLSEVTARVLEELCFHFTDGESPAEECERVFCSVAFRGPWNGRLIIGVEPGLLSELASNLLGDDESSLDDREHALLELGNVTCGNALPELESATAAFELDSPQTIAAPAAGPDQTAIASALLDGGKISVSVFREEVT